MGGVFIANCRLPSGIGSDVVEVEKIVRADEAGHLLAWFPNRYSVVNAGNRGAMHLIKTATDTNTCGEWRSQAIQKDGAARLLESDVTILNLSAISVVDQDAVTIVVIDPKPTDGGSTVIANLKDVGHARGTFKVNAISLACLWGPIDPDRSSHRKCACDRNGPWPAAWQAKRYRLRKRIRVGICNRAGQRANSLTVGVCYN